MKNLLLAALLLLLFTNMQCKLTGPNEIDCNNNSIHLSGNAKSYFFYKDNSYWVYYNEATNEYDSFFVSKAELNIRQPIKDMGDDVNKCYECARISICNTSKKEVFYLTIDNTSENRNSFQEFQKSVGFESDFGLFYTKDSLETINGVRPYEITIIDSLEIQSKWYKNLIEVKSDKVGFDNFNYRLYAKNIGLIKYIDKQANKWELVKHQVNQ